MSNKDGIKRFYIMPEVWVTVTQSQVFNWIKLINEEGISTDCISITSHKNSKETIKKFEESLKGKFIEVSDPKRLIVSDMYITLVMLKFYFTSFLKYKKIIFQTRLGNIGYPYRVLGWLPKVKLIFEGRGAGNEERKHSSGNEKVSLKMKIKAFFSETNEKLLLTKSNKIICVSHALEKYYIKKFNLSKDKFTVFPGAADSELFFNDDKLRFEVRQELELNNHDKLIVYSGRLEMTWEIPDKIFNFFKDIRSKDNHFKLLLVTPDVELANELIQNNNLEAAVYVKKVDLNEVNKYLNAADIGMLLREDIPMNNVASPTKFAEYMMAGLPVIISKGVHDFASIIDTTKFGVVVEGLDTISDDEFHNLMTSLEMSRYEIAKWGANNLSKRVFIEKYTNVLKQI